MVSTIELLMLPTQPDIETIRAELAMYRRWVEARGSGSPLPELPRLPAGPENLTNGMLRHLSLKLVGWLAPLLGRDGLPAAVLARPSVPSQRQLRAEPPAVAGAGIGPRGGGGARRVRSRSICLLTALASTAGLFSSGWCWYAPLPMTRATQWPWTCLASQRPPIARQAPMSINHLRLTGFCSMSIILWQG